MRRNVLKKVEKQNAIATRWCSFPHTFFRPDFSQYAQFLVNVWLAFMCKIQNYSFKHTVPISLVPVVVESTLLASHVIVFFRLLGSLITFFP